MSIPILLGPHFPTRRCIAPHACSCGYYGDPVKPCTCSPGIVTKYQERIQLAHLAEAMQYRSRMMELYITWLSLMILD